jgi:hypothetical protein
MARPTKTASELEQMILARVRDEMVCPTDLQAFSEVIDKAKHPDCLARVVLIASELRSQYDLADLEGTNRLRRA